MIEEGVSICSLSMRPMGCTTGLRLSGVFAVHDGPAMASADRFQILTGPWTRRDAPSDHRSGGGVRTFIQALQTIVSRNVKPSDAAVVSVTRIQAGETFNVIPESVELLGTARSFAPAVRDLIEERLTGSASKSPLHLDFKRRLIIVADIRQPSTHQRRQTWRHRWPRRWSAHIGTP